MNVRELKFLIEDLPDDMEIILQKDAEGNGYSPLSELNNEMIYIPDNTWSGEVLSVKELLEDTKEFQGVLVKPRCLLLIPVN